MKVKLIIIIVVFLCATAGSVFAQPWVEKTTPKEESAVSSAQRVLEILALETMLSSENKVSLEGLLNEIDKNPPPEDQLEKIYQAFQKRIRRDQERIRTLIGHLEGLQANKYLRSIGQVKAHEVKALQDHYRLLSAAIQSSEIWPIERRQSIHKLSEILSDSKGDTIAGVWKQAEKAVAAYYPSWNKRYQELRNLEKEAGRGKAFPASVLGFEEKQFIKSFGDLQALLRRVTPPKAGNF